MMSNARPSPQFSDDELITTLEEMFRERRNVGEGGGMTFREIHEASGISQYILRGILLDLKRQGRLISGREHREAMDGMMRIVPVYWLAPKEHKDE